MGMIPLGVFLFCAADSVYHNLTKRTNTHPFLSTLLPQSARTAWNQMDESSVLFCFRFVGCHETSIFVTCDITADGRL